MLADFDDPLRAVRADRALGLLSALAVAGGSGGAVVGTVPQTSQ
ncbi:hypothetical protein HNP02_007258 [Mycobacterium sp. AZCC_0083]|nr:hypothetical protein [Mycobacterium sp. AZCC_0083]